MRTVIIAICGKSASGKDSLAHFLYKSLRFKNVPVNLIVQDCTRPPRVNEIDGEDYNFISTHDFLNNIKNCEYLEYMNFKNWYYGTRKDSLRADCINIGIFNAHGIKTLVNKQDDYLIIPIYLALGLFDRLKRSYKREHKFKWEFIRRALSDYKDFFGINYYIHLYMGNIKLSSMNKIAENAYLVEKYVSSLLSSLEDQKFLVKSL